MRKKKEHAGLDLALEAYAKSDFYPFHMPGHKRVPAAAFNPYTVDLTEIDGFDNLHAPKGILKEAQERAANLYGAKKTYYLVNGSTCGILAAISAAVSFGGKILMSRNAHKSAFHAAFLRHLSVIYTNPHTTQFGIAGSADSTDIQKKLRENPEIEAVFLTSPTYEGIVSNIAEIAGIVHAHGIPMIVDEAHGAHLGFGEYFPDTAVHLGADVVVQSMHKVLPSLTQTALLHIDPTSVSSKAVERYLDIYETSSPSYVLMGGMERCVRLLEEDGSRLFAEYTKRLQVFYEKAKNLSRIHLLSTEDISSGEVYARDPSKLVIFVGDTDLTGSACYHTLRNTYHLQMEMHAGSYVLGMTSIMDTAEGFDRLYAALEEIDRRAVVLKDKKQAFARQHKELYAPKEKKMELHEAMERQSVCVPFEKAAGKICACTVSLYPPGIPILLPGETIEPGFIKNIRKCIKTGQNLQGIADIINEKIEIVDFETVSCTQNMRVRE